MFRSKFFEYPEYHTSLDNFKLVTKKGLYGGFKVVKEAIINKPNYIALGAFGSSKTKKVKFKADTNLLIKVKKFTSIHIVAIGGINNLNYKKLLLNKANFLAISGYVWNNKRLKPVEAIKELK